MSDWSFPYFDGYTGPWYSDGRFQPSVANGKFKPKGRLAELSRDHDTAYYFSKGNFADNDKADREYFRRTQTENWKNFGFVPRLIGTLPLRYHNPVGYAEEAFLMRKRKQKFKNMKAPNLRGNLYPNNQKLNLFDDFYDWLFPNTVTSTVAEELSSEGPNGQYSPVDAPPEGSLRGSRSQPQQPPPICVGPSYVKPIDYNFPAVGRTNFNVRPFGYKNKRKYKKHRNHT